MKKFFGLFSREKKETLDKGLEKTKRSFFDKISRAVVGKSKVNDEVLDDLEEALIGSDVGVATTLKIIKNIEARVERDKFINTDELNNILKAEIAALLEVEQGQTLTDFELPDQPRPYVMLVVGVNGVGKTTTIGKMAAQFKQKGYKVMMGAADTFRAAAVDQIKLWGERANVPVVEKGMNADPAAVAFEAVKQAQEQNFDIVLVDTAGRLHNKVGLMNELTKIKRVMSKLRPDAPDEIMLVLDGSTGQNAINQAREFIKATEVNSLTITKLDGTARGGVVLGIVDQFKIPVKYIGVGEKINDLQVFDKYEFVDSLFKEN